jgi:ribosomal protein L35
MKTNKSFSKRLKVTRKGKIVARKPGQNHFNARASRPKQMAKARTQHMDQTIMTKKVLQRYIGTPGK